MARAGFMTLPEKFDGTLTNVAYDMEGNMFLTPDNLFEWGDLVETDSGHPSGGPFPPILGEPRHPTGFNVYAGTTSTTMIRQNNNPLPYDPRYNYLITSFRASGHAPPSSNQQLPIPQPPLPVATAITQASTGFSAGTYRVALTLVNKAGRHTLLSPFVLVTLTANQGIDVPLYQDLPVGTTGIGVWMSRPGGTTLYLQRVVALTDAPALYRLDGPFRTEMTAPSTNLTYLGIAAQPNVDIGSAFYDLQPGNYQFYVTYVTEAGEALPSSVKSNLIGSTKNRSAFYVKPQKIPGGATGWYLYVTQRDGRTYVVYPTGSAPDKPLGLNQIAQVYSLDPGTWPATWQVAQRNLPTVDKSGIVDPALPPDALTALSLSGFDVGTYYFGFTNVEGNREGPLGPLSAISVSSTNSVRVKRALPIQKLRNAELSEVDFTNLPYEWSVHNPSSSAIFTPLEGEFWFQTNGSISADTLTNPGFASAPQPPDRVNITALMDEIEVYERTAGNFVVNLLEYSTATPVYKTTTPLATTTLLIMDDDGIEEIDYDISPTHWNASTLSYVIEYKCTGTTANLKARRRNGLNAPHQHRPRKHVDPAPGSNKKADTDPHPTTPYHNRSKAHVGRPRPKRKRRKGRKFSHTEPGTSLPGTIIPNSLIDRPVRTNVQTYELLSGADPTTTGWTLIRTPADGTTTVTQNATAALSGGTGYFFKDTGTATTSTLAYRKTFFTGANTNMGLGALVRGAIRGAAGRMDHLEIQTSTQIPIATLAKNSAGTWTLYYRHAGTYLSHDTFLSTLTTNVMNLDIQVSGGGTDTATISAWAVVGSASIRLLLARFEDVDLTGVYPQAAFFGTKEYTTSDTHETYIDEVRVTDWGQSYYRDHNVFGQVIGQAHYFGHVEDGSGQSVYLQEGFTALKPGQTYAVGCYARYRGVVGTQKPFYITLNKENGETIEVGSILNGGAGASGTSGWSEHILTFTAPHDPFDASQNSFEMSITSQNIGPGEIVAQEFVLTEIAPTDNPTTLDDKRDGGRATEGHFYGTIEVATPVGNGYGVSISRDWLRMGLALVDAPTGTTFDAEFRASDTLPVSGNFVTDIALLVPKRYLEFHLHWTGNGVDSTVLEGLAPYVEYELSDPGLLRDDHSELTGGTLVTEFQFPFDDDMMEVQTLLSGKHYSQPTADPVTRLDWLEVQFFHEDAWDEFRSLCRTNTWVIESMGRLVSVKILDPPETEARPDTAYVTDDGETYWVYAIATVPFMDVLDVTRLGG